MPARTSGHKERLATIQGHAKSTRGTRPQGIWPSLPQGRPRRPSSSAAGWDALPTSGTGAATGLPTVQMQVGYVCEIPPTPLLHSLEWNNLRLGHVLSAHNFAW